MCGIAGIVAPRGQTPSPAALEAMGAALVHRGPDSGGIEVSGSVGLAHRRLRIVDTSASADQPFRGEGHVLSFNGEIYNAPRLRARLVAAGAELRTHSDTEVLHHLLVRHGLDATLEMLEGMWAFAWLDTRAEEVHLARDPLGAKPLFVRAVAGEAHFASEIRALAAAAPVRPDVARAVLAVDGWAERAGEQTLFEGVTQVPPGGVVTLSDGRVTGRRVVVDATAWASAETNRALEGESASALADRMERELDEAVGRMLMGDAPIGTLVSGGIDSALVAALVTRHTDDHLLITADTGGAHSELVHARALADHLGLPLEVADCTSVSLLDDWAAATWDQETPIITHLNSLPFRRTAAVARDAGLKVVLTGEGADELFHGYPDMVIDEIAPFLTAPYRAVRSVYQLSPALTTRILPSLDRSRRDFAAGIIEGVWEASIDRDLRRATTHRAARRSAGMPLSYVKGHLLSLLVRADRMGMASSVEARYPYLDHNVVSLGLNLPVRASLRPGLRAFDRRHPFIVTKAILREVAARILPPAAAARPKAGFPSADLRDVEVAPEFFRDGWVAGELGLTDAALAAMADESPYHRAKLASVEIFGQLYGIGRTVAEVDDHIRAHARMGSVRSAATA